METVSGLNKIVNVEHGFYTAKDSQRDRSPILMNQIHSADVLVIDSVLDYLPSVDALITKVPGLNLTVKTADCAPILIADIKSQIIAAIHAGWRGTFQGIIENTLLKMIKMGGNLSYMVVGIGAHIQKKSFEVDEKMYTLFPITEQCFFSPIGNNHFLFDFHGYIIHRLKRAGIQFIDSVLVDTYTNNDYFSYRRDSKNPGRQYSSIMLKK